MPVRLTSGCESVTVSNLIVADRGGANTNPPPLGFASDRCYCDCQLSLYKDHKSTKPMTAEGQVHLHLIKPFR